MNQDLINLCTTNRTASSIENYPSIQTTNEKEPPLNIAELKTQKHRKPLQDLSNSQGDQQAQRYKEAYLKSQAKYHQLSEAYH